MPDLIYQDNVKQAIAKALRETAKEHGQDALNNATLITGYDFLYLRFSGLTHVYTPTKPDVILGGDVAWRVARDFESFLNLPME